MLGRIRATGAEGHPIERGGGQRCLAAVLAMNVPKSVRAAQLADLLDVPSGRIAGVTAIELNHEGRITSVTSVYGSQQLPRPVKAALVAANTPPTT